MSLMPRRACFNCQEKINDLRESHSQTILNLGKAVQETISKKDKEIEELKKELELIKSKANYDFLQQSENQINSQKTYIKQLERSLDDKDKRIVDYSNSLKEIHKLTGRGEGHESIKSTTDCIISALCDNHQTIQEYEQQLIKLLGVKNFSEVPDSPPEYAPEGYDVELNKCLDIIHGLSFPPASEQDTRYPERLSDLIQLVHNEYVRMYHKNLELVTVLKKALDDYYHDNSWETQAEKLLGYPTPPTRKELEDKINKLERELEFSDLYVKNKDLIFKAMEAYGAPSENYREVKDLYHKLGGLF